MKFYTILCLLMLGVGVSRANTFYVTNTSTSGAGSLDQAIKNANVFPSSSSNPHVIDFSQISLPATIAMTVPFDAIANPVIIDGRTALSYSSTQKLKITANLSIGSGDFTSFIEIESSNVEIYGLELQTLSPSHGKAAIYINDGDNIVISENKISDFQTGLFIYKSENSDVFLNLFEDNVTGLAIWQRCMNTEIRENTIGPMDGGPGIYLPGDYVYVHNNDLFTSAELVGIRILYDHDSYDKGDGANNVIANNEIHDFAQGVVVQDDAKNNLITENVMYTIYNAAILLNGSPVGNSSKSAPVITTAESNGYIRGTGTAGEKIELFTANSITDALEFLGSTIVDANNDWTYYHQSPITTNGVTATATDLNTNNTSQKYYLAVTEVDVEIEDTCTNCVGSFTLIPGEKYLITAWVHEEDASYNLTTFSNGKIYIDFYDGTGAAITPQIGPFLGEGQIIDGWQRVESEFTVPANAVSMSIRLHSATGDVYFDDIRILPFDGSMKSYVYDPIFMRLMAEMDERHYATFYEYDEEGKLIRIKKETEKGIMTIQETRNNNSK